MMTKHPREGMTRSAPDAWGHGHRHSREVLATALLRPWTISWTGRSYRVDRAHS